MTVVGEAAMHSGMEKILGNAVKKRRTHPCGCVCRYYRRIGSGCRAVFPIPGISTPIRLQLAGGLSLWASTVRTFGPHLHMIATTTRSANRYYVLWDCHFTLPAAGLDAVPISSIRFRPGTAFDQIGSSFGRPLCLLCLWVSLLNYERSALVAFPACLLWRAVANPMALNLCNITIPGIIRR